MRTDATFIGISVRDDTVADPVIAAKLAEICPVDIYADARGRVALVEPNLDECILCDMCVEATPPGAVTVHRLYDAAEVGA